MELDFYLACEKFLKEMEEEVLAEMDKLIDTDGPKNKMAIVRGKRLAIQDFRFFLEKQKNQNPV